MTRLFFFLLGFSLTLIGFVYAICYLNLMTIGYNFKEYVHFISRSPECIIGPIGFIILSLSIFVKGGKHELYI